MTEEEAKTKWCPHVRAGKYGEPRNRVDSGEPEDFKCIGSACMMWRDSPGGPDVRADTYFDEAGNPYRRTHGYCGLAGKP